MGRNRGNSGPAGIHHQRTASVARAGGPWRECRPPACGGRCHHVALHVDGGCRRRQYVSAAMDIRRTLAAITLALLLSGCASQIDAGVSEAAGSPGFLWGLWHGFIFPRSWIGSLFSSDIAVYAVPNSGGWYDFG